MPVVALYNIQGEQIGDIELSDAVFDVAINKSLIHDAVVMRNANQRQGTSATKGRGMVSGSTRKPWKQKGTGRARVGATRSPLWRHGGVTFGPMPRDYSYAIPKKAKKAALRSALTAKLQAGEVVVVDKLTMNDPKTKEMVSILRRFNPGGKSMLITAAHDNNINLSIRNIPGSKSSAAQDINVYDVLYYGKLIFTQDAVAKVEEVLTNAAST